ncbi:MAG TPA: branched-chain amino acid ABC transporter permease [Stellaceae bacterium]|nr:branched-chain amino acid ABC transporter permease [Stellaceae bacterium]
MSRTLWLRILLLAGLAALLVFPLLADKFYLQLFAKIMLMAVFAMSLDLLVGYGGLVSLGHTAFFGIGAYAVLILSPQAAAASLWLTLPVAVGAAALAALVIGLLVLRSSGVYFIMVTLAFTQMFYYLAIGMKSLGGSDGAYVYVKPDASLLGWTPFDLERPAQFYYVALALMAGTYFLLRMVLDSLFGQVLRGVKSNEQRLHALGFATFRYKLAAFILAGALAGLAGYFDAVQFGFVNPDLFGWRLAGEVLMMVILGGMGTLYGPILGAFALVLLENALIGETRHWLLPMGLFIIVAVLALPRGIGGLIERNRA